MTDEKNRRDDNEEQAYSEAMQRYLACKPFQFEWKDGRRPAREDLHDRAAARRDEQPD